MDLNDPDEVHQFMFQADTHGPSFTYLAAHSLAIGSQALPRGGYSGVLSIFSQDENDEIVEFRFLIGEDKTYRDSLQTIADHIETALVGLRRAIIAWED